MAGTIGYVFQQQHLRSQQEKITVALDSLQKTLGPAVPVNIEKLIEMKRPDLIRPELDRRYAEAKESKEQLSLAFGLASFGRVEVDYLISQIDDIEDRDKANLIAALKNDRETSIQKLRQAASECRSEALWKRKARLAMAALGLGDTVLPIDACEFEGRTDHGARTWFIHEFPSWELDLGEVIERVANTDSPALRSGISLAIGSIAANRVSPDIKERMSQVATKWYSLPDSSTHSAVAWLMREWGIAEPTLPDANPLVEGRNWFVNSQGVTFVRIAPKPIDPRFIELAAERPNVPEQPYWLANREVTRGEYEAFINDKSDTGEKPDNLAKPDPEISPTLDHPAQNVSWYDAVMYCNWLSRREGRTPAYRYAGKKKINRSNGREVEEGEWQEVDGANGYRLPKDVEWEYACRAGSDTDWSTGSDELLLAPYCQMYPSKLASPCGKKLPNAWGLHDMHGNVWEWCSDLYDSKGSPRVIRGGSWYRVAALCGSASRIGRTPESRDDDYGFRLALSSASGIPKPPEAGQD
jgi:formylglycine-generating enzyme required for sulfatase activity